MMPTLFATQVGLIANSRARQMRLYGSWLVTMTPHSRMSVRSRTPKLQTPRAAHFPAVLKLEKL